MMHRLYFTVRVVVLEMASMRHIPHLDFKLWCIHAFPYSESASRVRACVRANVETVKLTSDSMHNTSITGVRLRIMVIVTNKVRL